MLSSNLTQKIMVLLSATLLTGGIIWAVPMAPALACEAHEGQYHQIVGEVDVLVDVHTMTEHHQEMAKHSEVMGFSGSHVLVVQLLDRATGQAITKADLKADIVGPDQKAVAKDAALKWFAPPGRAPYYGLGLQLAKGTYSINVNFKEFQTPRKATFTYTVR